MQIRKRREDSTKSDMHINLKKQSIIDTVLIQWLLLINMLTCLPFAGMTYIKSSSGLFTIGNITCGNGTEYKLMVYWEQHNTLTFHD